jgi:hypothetical protein
MNEKSDIKNARSFIYKILEINKKEEPFTSRMFFITNESGTDVFYYTNNQAIELINYVLLNTDETETPSLLLRVEEFNKCTDQSLSMNEYLEFLLTHYIIESPTYDTFEGTLAKYTPDGNPKRLINLLVDTLVAYSGQ